ncbi:MAG: DinB family protein [Chloroflexi bacterium]|nr:DinB family protein [Chloroflexota bacterium]
MSATTLDRLARSRQRLLSVISELSEAKLEREGNEGWTVRQIVTHLIASEADHCRVVAVVARGDAHLLPATFDLDAHNAQRLAESDTMALPELLAGLREQREKTEALFRWLSEPQLAIVAAHPALGDMTLDNIFRIMALHETQHTREIEAALKDG